MSYQGEKYVSLVLLSVSGLLPVEDGAFPVITSSPKGALHVYNFTSRDH